ncbi:MAG: 30S ribosomal protein S16 [Patescibacteria group bacterium]|nr:30S ribosomal protein S16 [Patescibacteria group bacterium]
MLSIRFLRKGKNHQPVYRVVVTDKKRPPQGGRFLEILGFYNPITKEKNLKQDRIKYWISVGAQASDSVHNLLVKQGIIKAKKISAHKVSKKKEEEKKEEIKKEEVKEEKSEVKPEEVKPEEVKEEK